MFSHFGFHVGPRCKTAFAPDIRLCVQCAVEQADAEVGHADLIRIGEAERPAAFDILFVFDRLSPLAAGITPGLGDGF